MVRNKIGEGGEKMRQKRVYFDFNVFSNLINNEEYKKYISDGTLKKCSIFISVAHVEEYYKAYKNDKNQENAEYLKNLKEIMITIKKPEIILNPTIDSNKRIEEKQELFEDCYKRVEGYDTIRNIENYGGFLNKKEKDNIDKLRKNNPDFKYISNLDKKEIWNTPEIIEEIEKFSDYVIRYNNDAWKNLIPIYGPWIAQRMKEIKKIPPDFSLEKDCFKKGNINFAILETVMEFMSNLLSRCGFYRDKNKKKTVSGILDVSHLIYATYCEYLVSFDCRFRKRAEAIYYFLGIDTRVLSFEEFINEIKDN